MAPDAFAPPKSLLAPATSPATCRSASTPTGPTAAGSPARASRSSWSTAGGRRTRTSCSAATGSRRPCSVPARPTPPSTRTATAPRESANVFAVAPDVDFTMVKINFVNSIGAFNTAVGLAPQIISCSWGSSVRNPPLSAANQALAAAIATAVASGDHRRVLRGQRALRLPRPAPRRDLRRRHVPGPRRHAAGLGLPSGFASNIYAGRNVPDVTGLVGMRPRAAYIMLPLPERCAIDVDLASAGRPPERGRDRDQRRLGRHQRHLGGGAAAGRRGGARSSRPAHDSRRPTSATSCARPPGTSRPGVQPGDRREPGDRRTGPGDRPRPGRRPPGRARRRRCGASVRSGRRSPRSRRSRRSPPPIAPIRPPISPVSPVRPPVSPVSHRSARCCRRSAGAAAGQPGRAAADPAARDQPRPGGTRHQPGPVIGNEPADVDLGGGPGLTSEDIDALEELIGRGGDDFTL